MKAPDYLNEIAQKEWNRVVPALKKAGRFDDSDKAALEIYCTAYANFIDSVGKINRAGTLVNTNTGVKVSPAFDVMDRCAKIIDKFIGHFGFSPSSRKRMELAQIGSTDNGDDDFNSVDWDKLAERYSVGDIKQ